MMMVEHPELSDDAIERGLRDLVGPRCTSCQQLIIRASRHSHDWQHIDQPAGHQALPPPDLT